MRLKQNKLRLSTGLSGSDGSILSASSTRRQRDNRWEKEGKRDFDFYARGTQERNGQEASLETVVILSMPHSWFNLTRADQVMVAEATTYRTNVCRFES